ncbi:hypothetical protein GCM10008171_21970 [Methylopila jiangsuensis]|uniref:Uncharacterized protein n=1 Tax=Methylopila jiangsuensis TaxID=586230 RepID=A0A9W6JK16_9HYPH|nr:hypothetical protein GCM10008171_21970 [Methylopila jiangsuensis]
MEEGRPSYTAFGPTSTPDRGTRPHGWIAAAEPRRDGRKAGTARRSDPAGSVAK